MDDRGGRAAGMRSGARHRARHLRLGTERQVAAPGEAREDALREGLEGAPHQGRRRLLRGLRAQRERRARRGLLPSRHAGAGPDQEALSMLKVWDPLGRVLHWSLVLGVTVAWFTREAARPLHEFTGYAVLAVVLLRIFWGVLGKG